MIHVYEFKRADAPAAKALYESFHKLGRPVTLERLPDGGILIHLRESIPDGLNDDQRCIIDKFENSAAAYSYERDQGSPGDVKMAQKVRDADYRNLVNLIAVLNQQVLVSSTGTSCPECHLPQFCCLSGISCPNGHGYVEPNH